MRRMEIINRMFSIMTMAIARDNITCAMVIPSVRLSVHTSLIRMDCVEMAKHRAYHCTVSATQKFYD